MSRATTAASAVTRRFALSAACGIASLSCAAWPVYANEPAAARSVVKLTAATANGQVAHGSAVVIATEKVATSCHVLRDAASLVIEADGRHWPAQFDRGDGEMDLCLLSVPGLSRPVARIRSTQQVKIDAAVQAIGYPGGGRLIRNVGAVKSAYRMYDARVLRVSARFDQGASGGGLFTSAGELIGILTFKAPRGEAFHFAIPIDWVLAIEDGSRITTPPETMAFWEQAPDARQFFLRAAWFNSVEDWPQLFEICERWAQAEPNSVEAQTYLRLAESHLRGQ